MITNHSVFGGNIEIEDFNTSCPNKRRIQNQMEAVHLQQTLEKRKYRTEKEKKYKTMNLELLKKMKVISNTDGRPAEHLTDETWQKELIFVNYLSHLMEEKSKNLEDDFQGNHQGVQKKTHAPMTAVQTGSPTAAL